MSQSGYALLKSCSCIQSWYCDTLTYTPGTSLSPQPTPQETIPASCHTPFVSQTRGPPPSPLQESLPKLKNMLMMQNHSSLPTIIVPILYKTIINLPSSPPAHINPGWRTKSPPSLVRLSMASHCPLVTIGTSTSFRTC